MSLLALFALAVQLGLSFGHTHLEHAHLAKAAITQVSTPASDTGHDVDTGDICAICATVALAQTLIDSAPPVLPVPANIRRADIPFVVVTTLATTQRVSFQSRAPPLS